MEFENDRTPQEEEALTPQQPEEPQAAEAPAQEVPVAEMPTEEAPAPEAPAEEFQLQQPQEQPKKKTGLVIGIVAAVAAIALIIGLLFGLGVFSKDPHEAMLSAEKDALYGAVDSLAANFGNANAATQFPQSGVDMEMHLLLGDNLLDFIETALSQLDTEAELKLDWLKDIAIDCEIDGSSSQFQYLMGLGLGDKEVVKLDMIMDLEKASMYLGMPGLNPYYMQTQLEGAAASGMFGQYQELMQEYFGAMPSEAALQSCLRGYVDLLLELLKDPQVAEETVSVDGLERTYTTLTYRITEQQLTELAKTLLEKAKNDETLKQPLVAYSSYFNAVMKDADPQWQETDLWQSLLDAMTQGITGLEAHESQEANYLELVGYLDQKQALKGHKLVLHAADGETFAPLTWLTGDDGDAQRVRIVLLSESETTFLTALGKQTQKGGKYNGTFELTFGDKQTMTLELKDLCIKDGAPNGTIQLTPSIKLLKELLGDSYTAMRMIFGGELGLQLDMEGALTTGSVGFHVTSEGESVLGFTVAASYRDGKEVRMPSEDALLEGEDASARWADALDLEALMKKLEEAGIPTELLDLLDLPLEAAA